MKKEQVKVEKLLPGDLFYFGLERDFPVLISAGCNFEPQLYIFHFHERASAGHDMERLIIVNASNMHLQKPRFSSDLKVIRMS